MDRSRGISSVRSYIRPSVRLSNFSLKNLSRKVQLARSRGYNFIIKSSHRRSFISLRNDEHHRGSGRSTLARDYERMEFLIKFPFSFFSSLPRLHRTPATTVVTATPSLLPPPRALSSLSSGRRADKTPRIEVVGNNISVGVVMVAEY